MEYIETKRLILRELQIEDNIAIHEYSSDPTVTRYMNWGPNTEEDTTNFVQRSITYQYERPRKNFTFAVVLKSENKLIGSCGIYVSNPDNREGFLGYVSIEVSGEKAMQPKQRQHWSSLVSTG